MGGWGGGEAGRQGERESQDVGTHSTCNGPHMIQVWGGGVHGMAWGGKEAV